MAEDRAAVDGSNLSALPDKPPHWNTTTPEALSASEGSGQGVPACSNAVPEARPLTGELRDDPTTSTARQGSRTARTFGDGVLYLETSAAADSPR